ncbi:MAG: flagellar hook-associated protein FlgK [Proteobacteria bacterium]|nr:flagellar hook-associated protein FlgK [Pseudomonadota bacterium]
MASDLLNIGKSGALAARAALDVTGQNIANAGTAGYVRRTISQAEVTTTTALGMYNDISLSGVRITGIGRNADAFRQAEVRRTGADAARASAQVDGLTNADQALESSNLYPAITKFEANLAQLAGNPTDPAMRANTLASATTLAQSFNLASTSLAQVGAGLRADSADAVTQINTLATNLARLNVQISGDPNPETNQAGLLDQRDQILSQLSQFADVTTTFAPNQTVKVQLGGASGPVLVNGSSASAFAMQTAANGTISFTVGGATAALSGGSLAGKAQALTSVAANATQLDSLASALIGAANSAQAGGVALDGSAGQPLFSGTGAGSIAVALTSGSQLATAPAGAGANSRDAGNLTALQASLNSANLATGTDSLLFTSASAVQQATTTRDALKAIASNAQTSLDAQAGVNLDDEAANLLKYQQAFQASGKVMQVASTLFDSLLQIR